MKKLITNYIFNPSAGTLTFTDYKSISLGNILLVTNVNPNIIIYNFADSTKGGTVSTNILTFDYNVSAMSATDPLQVFYDDGNTALSNADLRASPITTEMAQGTTVIAKGDQGLALQQGDDGRQFVQDTNLTQVFGSQSLLNQTQQRLSVDPLPTDIYFDTNVINAGKPAYSVNTNGYSTAIMTIGGTWTGTVSFETWAGGASDAYPILGIPIASNTPVILTTVNGIWRFNVVGCQKIRARFSTPTSGNPTITIGLSQNISNVGLNALITGSGSQVLLQKGSPFELATWDDNLATVFGSQSLVTGGSLIVTSGSVKRLTVEATGRDVGDPFIRNFDATYKNSTNDTELFKKLEFVIKELTITNKLLLLLCNSAGCNLDNFVYIDETDR
jgi:hypothetical protein